MGLKKIADHEKDIEKQEQRISDDERSKYNRYKAYKKQKGRKSQEQNKKKNKFMDSLDDETKAKFDSVLTKIDEIKGKIQAIEEATENYNFYEFLREKATGEKGAYMDPRDLDDAGGNSDGGLYNAAQAVNDAQFKADVVSFIAGLGIGGLIKKGGEQALRQGFKKYIKEKIKRMRAKAASKKVKEGNHVFWSGGTKARQAAEAFAKENGKKTLEMTKTGKFLDMITNKHTYPLLKPAWDAASKRFAKNAGKSTDVFHSTSRGVRLESVWAKQEYPQLMKQGTSIKFHNAP